MKKKAIAVILLLILSICGGVVRAYQLSFGFDADTGLAVNRHPAAVILFFLSLAAFSYAAKSAYSLSRTARKNNSENLPSPTVNAAHILSAAVFILASIYSFVKLRGSLMNSEIILLFFSIFSGISILIWSIKSRGEDRAQYYLFNIVPSFWICYAILIFYHVRSVNPSIESYAYELVALCSAALMFLYSAGFGIKIYKNGMTLFFSFLTLYFGLISLIGIILAKLVYLTSPEYVLIIPYYFACLLYAFGVIASIFTAYSGKRISRT